MQPHTPNNSQRKASSRETWSLTLQLYQVNWWIWHLSHNLQLFSTTWCFLSILRNCVCVCICIYIVILYLFLLSIPLQIVNRINYILPMACSNNSIVACNGSNDPLQRRSANYHASIWNPELIESFTTPYTVSMSVG